MRAVALILIVTAAMEVALIEQRHPRSRIAPILTAAMEAGDAPALSQERKGGRMSEDSRVAQMDPRTAERVPVVLRVKLIDRRGGDKYGWDIVQVLSVLKNESNRSFEGRIEVAHYSWKAGVPDGECTVYHEPYGENPEQWRLLDGGAEHGVSHVAR
jgi:hypothetical protein